jgi:hypothetical protein
MFVAVRVKHLVAVPLTFPTCCMQHFILLLYAPSVHLVPCLCQFEVMSHVRAAGRIRQL